ncbi:MAG: glycosyltransferase [Actinobacteria bacterium]|nr:glycosyltransferase [Actinomycetota bacterium]
MSRDTTPIHPDKSSGSFTAHRPRDPAPPASDGPAGDATERLPAAAPVATDPGDETLERLLEQHRRFRGPRRAADSVTTGEHPTAGRVHEEPWPGRFGARLLILLNVLFTAAYLGWWSVGGHVGNPWLFVALAVAEAFTVGHLVGLWQSIWKAGVELPPPGETWFSIDVFVPTYGEPLDVLRRTVTAAVGMDGSHRTYVLDDAVRDEVRQLAVELGAEYIPRESSGGAKAGNLNHAMARTDGDLVVVFDADHVARRDFLYHLVGYFEDPDVALVQSPQCYGNAVWNPVARGAWNQQEVFYGPIKRGKYGLGAAFLCGTNAIIRRAALEQVGGFDQTTVTEDVATSLHLHRDGWSTVYFPFVLAEGEGPPTVRQYLTQQLRWAHGSISLLLSGAPLKLGLRPLQRLQYLFSTTYYFIGVITLIYLSLPLFALLAREGPFASGATTFFVFYIPHVLVTLYNLRRELQGEFGLRHMQFTFGAFPIYVKAAIAAFLGRETGFSATGAAERQGPPAVAWVTVLALVITVGAVVAAPFVAPLDVWSGVAMFWGVVNTVLLWPMTRLIVMEAFGRFHAAPAPAAVGGSPARPAAPTWVLGHFERPPLPEKVLPNYVLAMRALGYVDR